MTGQTIAEIAAAIGGTAEGQLDLRVVGLEEPARAGKDHLAIAMDPRFVGQLAMGQARAAVLTNGQDWQSLGLDAAILVGRPRLAMSGLTRTFRARRATSGPNIHPNAAIDPSAKLGPGCRVGPNAVIEADVIIGESSTIGPNAWIGQGVEIAARAEIGANSSICPGVRIGADFVGHPGIVLGGDGFSFVTTEKSSVETVRETLGDAPETPDATGQQEWIKIYSLGGVQIGDRVEIGANSSVDAGTIRPTSVGSGTKIDALVQVGHNAQVGENCLLCAHVAVGGSAVVGASSVLGGQVGVADNVSLGRGVVAGGATKILSNVPAGRAILGYPAMKMETHVETYKALRRLPRLLKRVSGLEAARKNAQDSDTSD